MSRGRLRRELPDPTEALVSDLIPALVEILGVEGPIGAEQLYGIFVKAAGRHRVGRQSRSALNKAVSKAILDGRLQERNEISQGGFKDRVLCTTGSPSVLVRPRGDREFVEIPASEVAAVMLRLERRDAALSAEALHRVVLEFYDTRRMTTNIQRRLQWVYERRVELAGDAELRNLTLSGVQQRRS